jgi:hypothetical protein
MADLIDISCPCGVMIATEASNAGRGYRCRNCGQRGIVPGGMIFDAILEIPAEVVHPSPRAVPSASQGDGCLVTGLKVCGFGTLGIIVLFIVLLTAGRMLPQRVELRADGSSEAALLQSLNAMRLELGPRLIKGFDQDLIVITRFEIRDAAYQASKGTDKLMDYDSVPADTMLKASTGKRKQRFMSWLSVIEPRNHRQPNPEWMGSGVTPGGVPEGVPVRRLDIVKRPAFAHGHAYDDLGGVQPMNPTDE